MPRSRRFRKNQDEKKFQHSKPPRKNRNKIYLAIGIISVAAVVVAAFFVFGLNGLFSAQSSNASPSPSINPSTSLYPTATPLASPAGEYSANGTRVLLMTSMGNITIQLRDDKPITSGNFKNLAQQGLYDGTLFHRVIAGFMIQGGAITSTTVPSIADEIGNDNVNFKGTIAMANTGQANSANSQFFINVGDSSSLYSTFDTSYTVFGRVIDGMDTVMAISNVATSGSPNDQPLQSVTLIKAIVIS